MCSKPVTLKGPGALMWILPLYLHVNQKSDDDDDSGEKVDFNGFAIFSISGHLVISTRLTFTGLKPCSLIMLHVKFEIHG